MTPNRRRLLVPLVLIAAGACSGVVSLGSEGGSVAGSGSTGAGSGGTGGTPGNGSGGGVVFATTGSAAGAGGATTSTTSTGGSPGTSTSSTGGGAGGDPVVSRSPASSFEYDTSLALGSNGSVFVTWVGVPALQAAFIGYAVSSDGGKTFPVVGTVPTPGGRLADHPTLAVDASDHVYLAWLGYVAGAGGTRTDTHVYVAMAVPGSTTFSTAVEASEPTGFTYANPWVTVTPLGSALVTYQRSGAVDLGIVAARSADLGTTWATQVVATDPHLLNDRDLPYPCPSAISGRIFVTYFSDDPAVGTSVGIGWSDDDGVTWIPPAQSPPVTPNSNLELVPLPPKCVAVESSVRVIFGYTLPPWSPDPSVLTAVPNLSWTDSVNDGTTFDLSNTALIDLTGNDVLANPQLIGDGAGGFDLAYCVVDQGVGSYQWARAPSALSFGNGTSFAPSSTGLVAGVDFDASRTDSTRLGDYTGLAASATTLFTSYVDNSLGASHIRVHVAQLQ